MPTLAFTLSLLALLFAPGPTNALLALAGAERGVAPALRLLPLVALAYGLSVVPLSLFGAEMMQQSHALRSATGLAAAGWVGWMAIAMWRGRADAGTRQDAGPMRLFITTLLNPKAFIIGLVLVPGQPTPLAALGMFFAVLAVAAGAWVKAGATLSRADRLPLVKRLCAGWLGLLALMLGSAAFSA